MLCTVAVMVLASGCRNGADAGPVAAVTGTSLPSSTRSTVPPWGTSPGAATARPGRTGASGDERALAVLREWDSRRSQAFATDDAVSLRRLYVADSPLADRDLAVLRDYRERGLRVLQTEQQVVSVEVHDAGPREVTLSVVERLGTARVELVKPSTGATTAPERALPASTFARRVLRFERTRGQWRLSWASEA